MSETAQTTPHRIPLATFLDGLSAEDAGHAKAAAQTIDELETRSHSVRGIEQQLLPLFIASLVAFVAGIALFLVGQDALFGLITPVHRAAVTVLLGALPTLAVYYAFRVRKRSRADVRAFDLNQQYFLPHGGIYFPASDTGERAWVVLIDQSQGWKPKPSKYDHIKSRGPLW